MATRAEKSAGKKKNERKPRFGLSGSDQDRRSRIRRILEEHRETIRRLGQ